MTLLEIVYMILALLQIRNLFLDYFYKIIEIVCLGIFLQSVVQSKKLLRFTVIAIVAFCCFQVFNAFWGTGYRNLNEYGNLINSVFLFWLSFGVLIYLLRKPYTDFLLAKPAFNFVLAIFVIFLTAILSDILLKFANQQQNNFALFTISIAYNLLKSFYLLLFVRGIWLMRTELA
jgi:uncharacterized protein YacL